MAHYLVAVIGADAKLKIDLAALRAVRQQTGMLFTRLEGVTFAEFGAYLRRIRMQARPNGGGGTQAPYVHLAMHMQPSGALFGGNELVTPTQLSEAMAGVPVLMLAGCQSTAIGDLLGIVPYVVTLLEDVEHDAARSFAQLFWLGIGAGDHPADAYAAALAPLPDVGEYVFLHRHGDFLA